MRIIIKKSLLFLIIASILFLISVPVRASSTTTGNATYVEEEKLDKEDIGYGVSYYKSVGETSATIRSGTYNQTVYYLNTVCNETIKVIPWAKFENNKWKLANVRELIADFEAKNPGWMVLAGVNADFFDINALNPLPYQPNNGQAFEGNIYRTSGKSYNSTIGIKNDGSVDSLIGQSVPPVKANMTLDVFDKNEEVVASFDIENINTAPDDDETAVFFGIYNSSHNYESKSIPTTPGAMVFYVEEADLALPNSATDFYGKGTITSYNAFSMAAGQFSVATKNQAVKDALAIGVKIRVQREWTGQFADVEYAIGGGTLLLSDGEAPSNVNTAASVMNTNHPRTAIGRKDDGSIVMAVVDGRIDESVSRGVYGDELAAIMKHAGCVEAYNLDGGGSSTMVVRENDEFVIKNVLSENYERRVGNCLLVVTKAPEYEVELTNATDKTLEISITPSITNGHDFDNLYAYITGGIEEKVVNGKVIFSDLTADSQYNCKFYYKIGDIKVDFPGSYSFMTTVAPHVFLRVEINENQDYYNFEVKYRDRGGETNLGVATLHINGHDYLLSDGKISLKKTEIGEIEQISIEYICNNSFGYRIIMINNPDSITLRFVGEIFKEKETLINSLFK